MEAGSLCRLTTDLLVEVLSLVDGPTIASAACACEDLRGAAKEEALWEELCHGAWPSTMEAGAKRLVSSMPGGFARLYANSLPLLLYAPSRRERGSPARLDVAEDPAAASPDLVSFVDVYYKERCVLSRVVHGVPPHDTPSGGAGGEETGVTSPPSIPLEAKEEGGVGVLNWMLEEDLTLSWVLADVRRGRAVNLSGGKPAAVHRSWPSSGDVVVRFGCAVPVERQLLASGAAECIISMRCQVSEADEEDGLRLRCTGIELQVEDAEGGPRLDGLCSLAVLGRALCNQTTRTRNRRAVEEGYRAYLRDRRAMREGKKTRKEGVAERLCALSGMAVICFLLGICVVGNGLKWTLNQTPSPFC